MQFLFAILATCVSVSYACGPGIMHKTTPQQRAKMEFTCITSDANGTILSVVTGKGCADVTASPCQQAGFAKAVGRPKLGEIKALTTGASLSSIGADACNIRTCLGKNAFFIA